MSKLNTMEKIVLKILEEVPVARTDDYVLIHLVCKRIAPELIDKSFGEVLYFHKSYKMPNWETITRARRKIQAARPDLVENEIAKRRNKEEQVYREYARS